MEPNEEPVGRPLVAVSACLLGAEVRHDGGHCRDRFLTDRLGPYVDFESFCPEEGAGMSTPREAVRLVRGPDGALKMVGSRSGTDWTGKMAAYTADAIQQLDVAPVDAFILKKGSPSCGPFRVRRYDDEGNRLVSKDGGLFAEAVRARYPYKPMEDDGRLNDPGLRHQFLVQLFASHRLRQLAHTARSRSDVMIFQRREKLLLMAHSPAGQKELGRIIADDDGSLPSLLEHYSQRFREIVATPTHRGRVLNVLQHMAGYFRGVADPESIRELTNELSLFQEGIRDASGVTMLIKHHARHHGIDYLTEQTVLTPYPPELLYPFPDPHLRRKSPKGSSRP